MVDDQKTQPQCARDFVRITASNAVVEWMTDGSYPLAEDKNEHAHIGRFVMRGGQLYIELETRDGVALNIVADDRALDALEHLRRVGAAVKR